MGSIISSLSANSNLNNNNNSNALNTENIGKFHTSASYAGSDVDSTDYNGAFGFKRGTLSLGGLSQSGAGGNGGASRLQSNMFASASISGGIPSHSSVASTGGGSGRFLEKFSAVAEATREVELLGGGLGSLSIGTTSGRVPSSSRRTSFLTPEGTMPNKPFLDSTNGSIDEGLNVPSSRQSVSERIDNYLSNNGSPTQAFKTPAAASTTGAVSRAMSISSDVRSEHNSVISDHVSDNNVNSTNIWNTQSAASAATFMPMYGQASVQQQQQQMLPPGMGSPQGYPAQGYPPQMYPFGFPPFPFMPMMPPQFGDNGVQGQQYAQQQGDTPAQEITNSDGSSDSKDKPSGESNGAVHPQSQHAQPGFNNNGSPFMYPQAFSPFPFMSPPLTVPQIMSPMGGPQQQQQQQQQQGRKPRSPKPSGQVSGQNAGRGGHFNGNGRQPGKPKMQFYRSAALEEFRNSGNKNHKLKDIFGNAVEFSKDQHGSRFIQQALAESTEEEKEVFFNEIRDVAVDLMTDVFGNYVIQKYFEHGSETQKKVLLDEMRGKIKDLSLQMYGCRVVQRAIEFVALNDQIAIINELKDYVLPCIKDQNGNHVIQKAIEKIPIVEVSFIFDSLKEHIYHLSTHPYGCRVIQRLLEFSNEEDQIYILNELNKFTYFLIQDQYGNYVIQHIIEHGKPEDKTAIVQVVSDSVVDLSKHKFASNVVEKCVMFGNEEQVALILDKVLVNNDKDDDSVVDDRSPLGLMMKDQFANYVVQKLVEVSKGKKKRILIKKIKQYLKQISKPNYGKHLASIEKLIVLAETAEISDDDDE